MSSDCINVFEASPQPSSRWADEQQQASGSCATGLLEDSISKKNIDNLFATADVNAKELVQQHMKIAEEAVAGWEKAEAEASELKEKLNLETEQKLASEERASQLDAALKECMKQLRHVREELDQKVRDALLKKAQEWEKIRKDLEASVDDANSELCEVLAESQAMSKSLQEQERTIAEISNTKACLEADSSALHVRLASVEKEYARLKHELRMLGKELELRNGELEYAKRAKDAASKSNLESSKKIVKLEEECQRLKLLAKKRQPSPAPMSQRRGEADLMNDRIRRCSPCRRSTTFLPLKTVEVSGIDFGFDDGLKEENKTLSDQLLSTQEEAKSLRELLAKKDDDLKSSRSLYARTARKLLEAETRLDARHVACGLSESLSDILPVQKPKDDNVNVNIKPVSGKATTENKYADSWASALIAELAHINSDKTFVACDAKQSPITIDFMDDFVEMEKIASSTSPGGSCNSRQEEKFQDSTAQSCVEDGKSFEGLEHRCKQEFKCTNELCNELKGKLIAAEDQLLALQEKQSISESTIKQLQEAWELKSKIGPEKDGLMKAAVASMVLLEDEKDEIFQMRAREILTKVEARENENVWEANLPLVGPSSLEMPESEISEIGAALAAAMRKVLDIVESIGRTDYSFPYAEWISTPLENDGLPEFSSPGKRWRSSGLDACVESLINLCNSLVQGKVDIIDFIAEVASALDWLVGLIFTVPDKTSERNGITQRINQSCSVQVDRSHLEMLSAESSPTQLLCSASDVEDAKMTEQHDMPPDQSSVSNLSFQYSESSTLDEDVRKSEEMTLKVSLDAEIKKASKYESEILRLKVVNDQLEHSREQAMAKLADLRAQVVEAEGKIQELSSNLQDSQNRSVSLEAQVKGILKDKQAIENVAAELEDIKGSLESDLQITRENIEVLEMRVQGLEEDLSNEVQCRKEADLQLLKLKEKLKQYQGDGTMSEHSQVSIWGEEEAERSRKEQDIAAAAEKLAECQRTILDLGKQLKALGVSKSILDVAFVNRSESPKLPCKPPFLSTQRLTSNDQNCPIPDKSSKAMECNADSVNVSSSRNEKDLQQQQLGSIKRLKDVSSLSVEEPVTPARRGGHAIAKLGKPAHFDIYTNRRSNNRFPSPTHEERDGAQANGSCHSSLDPVSNSPMRSPARFLSLRGKSIQESSKQGDGDSTEKHGSSGFSRFFARTKNGH